MTAIPQPTRCTVTWTPEYLHGLNAPKVVQCTNRDDVEHDHHWSAVEDAMWREHEGNPA